MRCFENVGNLVKKHRKKLGMSQEKLARSMGYKNGQYISNLERNLSGLPLKEVKTIKKILQIESSDIKLALVNDYIVVVNHFVENEDENIEQGSTEISNPESIGKETTQGHAV